MANNYVQFSAELVLHALEERVWLKEQLEDAEVATWTNPDAGEDRPRCDIVPPEAEGHREGDDRAGRFPRFLCDRPDLDCDGEGAGFECAWDERDAPGSVVFFADECGSPDRVGYLVQKYLRQFHPDACWSLTWSESCSKPRVGEFGGGGLLVTAGGILHLSAHEFVAQQQKRFERIGRLAADDEHPDFDIAAWTRAVRAGQTRLGYWDWVLDQLVCQQNAVNRSPYGAPATQPTHLNNLNLTPQHATPCRPSRSPLPPTAAPALRQRASPGRAAGRPVRSSSRPSAGGRANN